MSVALTGHSLERAVRTPRMTDPAEGERSTFLKDVRHFLSISLTLELREAGRNTIGVHSDINACRLWHKRLYERGWIAPAWPKVHGGTGWATWQHLLFESECAANDAPVLFAGGLRNVGPLLISRGTPQQQARYLPAILDGRDLWCQGFSEPGAGSDLAALQTRAVAIGDDYVVNGSKIWTTGAHIANRMFCLVRTATQASRHAGITFLLIDMPSRGLSIKPIYSLGGDHEFNEVYFDDVKVPKANRIGGENEGWGVAKQLMRFARASNTTSGHLRRAFHRAASEPNSGEGRLRLCELECELRVFEALELSTRGLAAESALDSERASMLKVLATELHQNITAFALDAAGPAAMLTMGTPQASHWLENGGFAAAKYLATRAASIYSGTNETHRNLMAKKVLRL